MFPFQFDLGKKKIGKDEAYEEFRHMLGKSAFDEFTPSHNLRTLIHSSQLRRSIDAGDRRKLEKQKDKSNRRERGDDCGRPQIEDDSQLVKVWSINDDDDQHHLSENHSIQSDDSGIENHSPSSAINGHRQTHTDRTNLLNQQKSSDTKPSDLTPSSQEANILPSPRTPTEEQPFADPMERLRRRTELEIKESFSTSGPTSAGMSSSSSSPNMSFYGFPHSRSIVIDGKRRGENKWRRSYAEPRLHVSEPLWVPTFQNRSDVMSQFAPYDERLNNNGSEDWSVWEVDRFRAGK